MNSYVKGALLGYIAGFVIAGLLVVLMPYTKQVDLNGNFNLYNFWFAGNVIAIPGALIGLLTGMLSTEQQSIKYLEAQYNISINHAEYFKNEIERLKSRNNENDNIGDARDKGT